MTPEWLSLGSPAWERVAYCLYCGARLVQEERFGARRPVCPECDFVLFRTPATGAAVLVARGREILMVRRAIEPYRYSWGLPAGYQEYGESPEQAAVRETEEETGLVVRTERVLELFYTTDDPRKEANLVVYLARVVAGTLRAADDAAEARFFSLDSLPENIAFHNNRILLDRLRARFPQGNIT